MSDVHQRHRVSNRKPQPVILRVTQASAFDIPQIRALIRAAVGDVAKNPERTIAKLQMQVAGGDPRLAMWVGIEAGEPRSLLLVTLPFDPITDWPMFDLAANRGSWALAQATIRAGIDFLKAAGYNQALAVNFSGRNDRLYMRAGTRVGLEMKPRATMMEVNF